MLVGGNFGFSYEQDENYFLNDGISRLDDNEIRVDLGVRIDF